MLALVALDTRQIAYMSVEKAPSTVMFRAHNDPSFRGGKSGRVFAQYTFRLALEAIRWH